MSDKTLSFTQRSLAEALDNVRCLSDLGPELIAEQVFAASAQQPAVAVQDGWKLVPVEPTLEMLNEIQLLPQFTREALDARYRAMLAAAPAAPVAVGREPVARAFGKVCGGDAEHNTVNVRVSGPVPPELRTIGTAVALYAAPPATQNPTGDSASPVAEQPASTTSDRYRAELYDEVWEQARSMGYGNVTMALAELERLKAAEQPLPHWAPCNPACDPELNGSMSKLCDCAQAKSALGDQSAAAPVSPAAQEPAEDAGLAFSALPCAGFWRWLHRCNRVPPAAEHPIGDSASPVAGQSDHSVEAADMMWCACGDGYPAASYDAGFIHGSGMCQNCDAAIPARDIQPGTVAVPREVLRVLTDTAIAEWHDPSESEANQDKKECQCCGVQDGHNADCAVSIALHLLGKDGEA